MKKFGSAQISMSQGKENDIFLMRLHLLVVMVKAALKGYPIGEFRKKAGLDNAASVHSFVCQKDLSFLGPEQPVHLFKERVKLLSIMATAILSEDYPLGDYRKEAVLDNIRIICEQAFPDKKLMLFPDVLKVA